MSAAQRNVNKGHRRMSRNLLWSGVLILAGAAAYANSLHGPFILDDDRHIVNDRHIVSLSDFQQLFEHTHRPVVRLSLAVNYAVGKLDVAGYHLTNITIHILAALVLFGIVRRTLLTANLRRHFEPAGDAWAFTVAMLWLIHPLQTQAVTYVIQRSESLMGLFYLLTLYGVARCAVASDARRSYLWAAVTVVCCAAGMATKEVMVTAPLVALLYDRSFLAGSLSQALRRRWGLYIALAATWLVLAGLIEPQQLVHDRGSAGFAMQDITPLRYALTQPGVVFRYLQLSLWPVGLCFDYAWPPAQTFSQIAIPAIAIVALLVATAWLLWRRSWIGFIGACFFLILAPTSSIMPIRDLAVEHRMYLSLAAVVVLVVFAARRVVACLPGGGRAAAVLLALVIAPLMLLLTINRNHDYHGEVNVWRSVHRVAPDNPRALTSLGSCYYRRSPLHMNRAGYFYRQALRLDPDMAVALAGMALIYHHQGDFGRAASCLVNALKSMPEYASARDHLGVVLYMQGRYGQAVEQHQMVLAHWPLRAQTHSNLGNALRAQGKLDEAISHFRRALSIDPHLLVAYYNLAHTLESAGRLPEALAQYRAALQVNAADAISLRELAWFLATCPDPAMRRPGEAVRLAGRAAAIRRYHHPLVLDVLAAAQAAAGDFGQAIATAQHALDLALNQNDDKLAQAVRQRLMLYQRGRPYYQPPPQGSAGQ